MAFLTRLALAAVFVALAVPWAAADPRTATEDEVKAAFVFRFGSFVEWPGRAEGVGQPFVITVSGDDGIARRLEELTADRTMAGRPIEVRRHARGQALGSPEILFIGAQGRARLADLLAEVDGRPVLVVTEIEGAVESGSMIDLVLDGGRIRFDVSTENAERHGLKISSRVLAIARRVDRGG